MGALLSIEANALVTESLKSGHKKEKIPIDPNTCVQVHVHGNTITRDLKRIVQRITKTAPLMRYYVDIIIIYNI